MGTRIKKSFLFILSRSFYLALGVAISVSIYVAQAAWNTPVTNGTSLTPTIWNDLVAKISELDGRSKMTFSGEGATMNLPAGSTYTVLIWGTYFTCEDFGTYLQLDTANLKLYSGAGNDSAGCDQNAIMARKTGVTSGNHTLSFSRGGQWDFVWTAIEE